LIFIFQAWDTVLKEYNNGQTGGFKTLKNLQDKYKNEKKLAKQRISENREEMMKTGGGSAKISDEIGGFQFSEKQISGLGNKFDSDMADEDEEIYEIEVVEEQADVKFEQETPKTVKRTLPLRTHPNFSNKKMKTSIIHDEFYEAKLEGIKLDNELKRIQIEKAKLELKKMQKEDADE
jgi:hypothetical protein